MKMLAAKNAKNRFGMVLDTARVEPVGIEKHGRPVAVVLSVEEYKRLEALEHAYWVSRAKTAAKKGFIGPKKSEKLLKDLLGAEG